MKFKPQNLSELELQTAQIKAHEKFYSLFNIIKKLFKGKIIAFLLGLYANNLNHKWRRVVQEYLWYLKGMAVN